MKVTTSTALMVLVGVATARPDAVRIFRKTQGSSKFRREVPQEHSHEKFLTGVEAALNLNNVDEVQAAVFGLLGNAAAAAGAGNVEDLDCLQQRIADQAFTNAKEANDIEGLTNALIFRALERNTAAVGQASALCESETAVNPEIAAIQQHQDPASDGAAALNKQITLDLAVQLASVGADPQLALQSGTFEPGDVNDATGAGNTCDVIDDPEGCIFTQNLLVEDATAEEIDEAVAAAGGNANDNAADDAADDADAAEDDCEADDDATAADDDAAADEDANADSDADANADADDDADANADDNADATATQGVDVNAFEGNVGSAPVPIISSAAERPFAVNGDTFLNAGAAIQRACDVQKNACANAANSGAAADVDTADCETQQQDCLAANSAAARKMRLRLFRSRRQARAADTGSCGSPAISFGTQDDRPDEQSFAAVNQDDFQHGSALGVGVIADFICGQLASKCDASDATVSACEEGAAAAGNLEGQDAADAFNDALGV
ncbi:hypothetical protein F5X99DRAFT_427326 [Biscogniauxia marginata]|nr:hypothetical protein F5X99DRAFT_427326 [Biscogniauxia marginata]